MKSLSSFVVCGLLFLSQTVFAGILPGNFLANPSVEEDLDDDGLPDGWFRGGNDPEGDIWDTEDPVSGNHNLLLLDEGDAVYTTWYTNVDLPMDIEELELQWDWKYVFSSDNESDEFRMTIAWQFEGNDIQYDHVVVREDQPDYITENMIFFVPADSDSLRLEFVTGGPQTETGAMFIDDISIAIPGQSLLGDFNDDGAIDVADIDLLTQSVISNANDPSFDLDGNQLVDQEDRRIWVDEIKRTYFGDSNLDGEFGSSDLVSVFTAGQYEDGVSSNSSWASGDWNGDSEFDSGDFVTAFSAGGFEIGPRGNVAAVPEPASLCILIAGVGGFLSRRRQSF